MINLLLWVMGNRHGQPTHVSTKPGKLHMLMLVAMKCLLTNFVIFIPESESNRLSTP